MKILIFIFSLSLAPLYVVAANLSFGGDSRSFHVGEIREVDVLLDAEGTSLNVVAGTILFSSEMLSVDRIETDGSPVDIWIERPTVSSSGAITWSGMIPGGWSGVRGAFFTGVRPGTLFKIFFKVVRSGEPSFSFDGLIAKANDGSGADVAISGRQSFISLIDGNSNTSPLLVDSHFIALQQSTREGNQKDGMLWYAAIIIAGCVIFLYAARKIIHFLF